MPADITNSPSLTVFRNRLKTFLFHHTFSGCSSASESPDFMALYKLVFNFNFNFNRDAILDFGTHHISGIN